MSSEARLAAGLFAATFLLESEPFKRATRIACYCAMPDEFETGPILNAILQAGKSCYLPVLDDNTQSMHFAHYDSHTSLSNNRYGIPEPDHSTLIANELLDIALVPLLAFDRSGYRLGMGGGYYDRAFSFLRSQPRPAIPYLIGLAFAQQIASSLPHDEWDVPLDAIITEQGFFIFPLKNEDR